MEHKYVYLIRHGQTAMNAQGKCFSGISDISLSETGIMSLKKISEHKIFSYIEEVYVTKLIRTHETADILFPTSIPRHIIPELSEMDFGSYEGKTLSTETENDPVFYQWIHDPKNLTFPNGENVGQHALTAYQALLSIIKTSTSSHIAVISHATTIRLLIALALHADLNIFRNIPCDNAGVTLLDCFDDTIKIKYINAQL